MSYRATWPEVEAILESTSIGEVVGAQFLETANVMVSTAYGSDTDVTPAQLKQLEIWLTCHLISIKDRRASKEKVGDETTEFDGKTGMGLEATLYGQQVIALDVKGKLTSEYRAKKRQFVFRAGSPLSYYSDVENP